MASKAAGKRVSDRGGQNLTASYSHRGGVEIEGRGKEFLTTMIAEETGELK